MKPSSFRFKLALHFPRVLRALTILLLCLALGGGAIWMLRGCSFTGETVTKGGKLLSGVTAQDTLLPMGTGFLAFNGLSVRCFNQRGDVLWEASPPDNSGGYQMEASAKRVALYKDASLQLLNEKGEVTYSGTLPQPIQRVRCGVGLTAVEYVNSASIVILEKDGTVKDTYPLVDSLLMDFGFYSSGDLLWMTELDVSGQTYASYMDIYQPSKKLQVNGYKTSDQLYYKPLFFKNDIYLLGTHTLDLKPSDTKVKEESTLVYGWEYGHAYVDDEQFVLLLTPNGQDNPSVVRIYREGKVQDYHVPAGSLKLMAGAKCVYAVTPQAVYSIPYGTGGTQTYAFRTPVDGVLAVLEGGRLVVSSAGQAYLVALP